jgi:pimeloyl-ACP methyl ester carboxylesterase
MPARMFTFIPANMAESGYLEIGQNSLHYLKYGSGSRLLLAFHGYSNSASLFYPFESYLGKEFTILSIDLPHHGKSKWPDSQLLHKEDLVKMVIGLKQEYHVEQVSLMGYSLGGRVCLCLAEWMPEVIESVVLIASDGLVFNPLYYFVTKTFFGKKLFRKFLTNPAKYLKFIDWLNNKKLLNPSQYKFAMYYLESDADRAFLLKVWPGMSLIVPRMNKLRKAITAHKIPVHIFMGSYDRIIPLPHAYKFRKGLNTVQLHILEKGHRAFDSQSMPQMANCLITGKC